MVTSVTSHPQESDVLASYLSSFNLGIPYDMNMYFTLLAYFNFVGILCLCAEFHETYLRLVQAPLPAPDPIEPICKAELSSDDDDGDSVQDH